MTILPAAWTKRTIAKQEPSVTRSPKKPVLRLPDWPENHGDHPVLGTIHLSDNIMTKAADESVKDTMRGTFIWHHEKLACPDTISQIYRRPMRFYMNGTDTNLEGGLAVLEKDDQIISLETNNLVLAVPLGRLGDSPQGHRRGPAQQQLHLSGQERL